MRILVSILLTFHKTIVNEFDAVDQLPWLSVGFVEDLCSSFEEKTPVNLCCLDSKGS